MTIQVSYLENGLVPQYMRPTLVEPTTLRELSPKDWVRPYVAFVDGSPVLRADWELVVEDGRSVAFIEVTAIPQGGGGGGSDPLRTVLMIAVLVAAPQLGALMGPSFFGASGVLGMSAGMWTAAFQVAGMALVNALVPPPKPPSPQQAAALAAPSPTYSLGAQGNSARLESAIPEHFGRLKAFPDFAAVPYQEYAGNEQYLYQLLVVGRGYYDLSEGIFIEDTPISSFPEVETQIVLPGTAPTLFPTNVVTSVEVSGQAIEYNTWLGGFTVNNSGTDANYVGLDFVMPKGLYYANDNGALSSVSLSLTVQSRQLDSNGTPISAWATLATPSFSGATNTPQRHSVRYIVSGRVQVRVMRNDVEQTDARYGHSVVWAGLRAYLVDTGASYGDVTMIAMKMRASNSLSQTASRKINVIATRRLPAWNGSAWNYTTATSATPATRSIAWALAYAAKQMGLTDAQIDLATLLTMHNTWESRGDYFDGRFDNFLTFWEAVTKIAGAGRAKPYMQGGVMRFVRDQAATVPVALYSMRNIVKNSFSINYLMPSEDTSNIVKASYFDSTTWAPATVTTPKVGTNADRPAKIDLFGVTSRNQAYREALYHAASNRFRRRMISFTTEMEGFIPSFGDLVAVQHDMPAWGQGGEVVEFFAHPNKLTYTETVSNAAWAKTNTTITENSVTAPDGTLTGIRVTVANLTNARFAVGQTITVPNSAHSMGVYLSGVGGVTTLALWPDQTTTVEGAYYGASVIINLTTKTSSNSSIVRVTDVGGGWVYAELTATPTAGAFAWKVAASNAGSVNNYNGNGTSYWAMWHPSLVAGSSVGTYQPVLGAASSSYIVTTSEPLTWDTGTHYMVLRKRDGSVDGPHAVTKGGTSKHVILPAMPGLTPYTGMNEERTFYSFGWAQTYVQRARVVSVRPKGIYQVQIECINEDDNVHTADTGATPTPLVTSQLAAQQTSPSVQGLVIAGSYVSRHMMFVSWQPSPWADHYVLQTSPDGTTWTLVSSYITTTFLEVKDSNESVTYVRVAAVGVTQGPWASAMYTVQPLVNVANLTYTVSAAGALIKWAKPLDQDYKDTTLRTGTSWETGTALYTGSTNQFLWPRPGTGDYTLWAKHNDINGAESATATMLTVTYTEASIDNSGIVLNADGTLSGGGGGAIDLGQVAGTLGHLQFNDDLLVINLDGADIDVELRFGRTTGGTASFTWNGQLIQASKPFRPTELGLANISATAPTTPFAGQVWIAIV